MFQGLAALRAYLRAYLGAHMSSQRGVTMVEYGIILGLIAIAAVVTIAAVGDKILDAFQQAENADWPETPG